MPFEKRRTSRRTEIIKTALEMFIEKGIENTTNAMICNAVGISPGNLTFYFPTRLDLFAVMINELCEFQRKMMEDEIQSGKSDMLSYCLELTAMAAICEEDAIAREFYVTAYSNEQTISIIRKNDVERTKAIFGEYRLSWSDAKWKEMQNIVSGIEYATIITTEENTELSLQIESTLDSIMLLYGVPEEMRRQKIAKVLSMDYRALGRRILQEFKAYITERNEEALKQARERSERSRQQNQNLNPTI